MFFYIYICNITTATMAIDLVPLLPSPHTHIYIHAHTHIHAHTLHIEVFVLANFLNFFSKFFYY